MVKSLVRIGNSFGLIIPSKWLSTLQITERDKVVILLRGSELVIRKSDDPGRKLVSIPTEDLMEELHRRGVNKL